MEKRWEDCLTSLQKWKVHKYCTLYIFLRHFECVDHLVILIIFFSSFAVLKKHYFFYMGWLSERGSGGILRENGSVKKTIKAYLKRGKKEENNAVQSAFPLVSNPSSSLLSICRASILHTDKLMEWAAAPSPIWTIASVESRIFLSFLVFQHGQLVGSTLSNCDYHRGSLPKSACHLQTRRSEELHDLQGIPFPFDSKNNVLWTTMANMSNMCLTCMHACVCMCIFVLSMGQITASIVPFFQNVFAWFPMNMMCLIIKLMSLEGTLCYVVHLFPSFLLPQPLITNQAELHLILWNIRARRNFKFIILKRLVPTQF